MRLIAIALALGAACVAQAAADGGAPASPRATPRPAAQAQPAEGLRIPIDTAAPIRLRAAAAGVVVGNPSVAGVSVQNDRLLFVTGRSYGSTSVTVVDADGATLYHGRVTVVPDESDMVVVTRGAETSRMICTPLCRPNPDIGDGATSFSRANEQVTARAAAAGGGQ